MPGDLLGKVPVPMRMLCLNWVGIMIVAKNLIGRPWENTTIQTQGRVGKKLYRPQEIWSIWNK